MTPRSTLALSAALMFVLVAGCDEGKPKPKAKSQIRETIGKTTQEVRNLDVELTKGGKTTDGKVHATDYITLQADVYRTSVANIAKLRVKQDMALYETINDKKVESYDEFMEHIIKKGKADGIQLPMLPYYQEYGYDGKNRELVVIEYPAKKKAEEDRSDRELGRK